MEWKCFHICQSIDSRGLAIDRQDGIYVADRRDQFIELFPQRSAIESNIDL